ncbi:MAG TPA: transcriptional repressor LexA [Phycisphaerae bacterium]|nr:transcriptional repressor LexA [Phycisphaerae bacterium]
MENPTPRQLEILRYIRDFTHRHGYSPTLQETGDHLGLTKVTVFEHVAALERKGLLSRGSRHKARSLRVRPEFAFPEDASGRIPLAGRIAAGQPIEAIEDRQALDLQSMFDRPGEVFALRVNGDSMIDEQIRDGDYVICHRRADVRDGETVVALLDNGEATLKKLYRQRGRARLQPANPAFKPIYADNVNVQGVVIGVVRRV